MRQRLPAKILILALLVMLLGACDSGLPTPVPTTPPQAATPTDAATDPGGETVEPTAPPEEIAAETPEVSDTPTLESDVPVRPPTVAARTTPQPLPDGPLTVVTLGDSLTEGDGDTSETGGGFPARLERSLNDVRPGSKVINLGKSGWTSQQMVDEQIQPALDAKPNIATVWIGSNDLWYNNGPEGEAQDVEVYSNNIDATLNALTGAGAHVFIALLDDQSLRPFAQPSNGYFNEEQLQHMSHLVDLFNDVVREKAAQYGATTVDFFNTTIFIDPDTLYDDGLHANSKGHDLVAAIWFEAIRRIL